MIKLRPYQTKLKNDVYSSWQQGHKNVVAVLPTGGGKTVVMSSMAVDFGEPTVAIAHRQELVQQISIAMARMDLPHRIVAPDKVVSIIIQQHIKECGVSYVDRNGRMSVTGVDTLIRRKDDRDVKQWANTVKYWQVDESHHLLFDNKWGTAVQMFPNARGVGFTATPIRCDRKSLHVDQGGVFDDMIVGLSMRDLINLGSLAEYQIYGPPQSINDEDLTISKSTGEVTTPSMKRAAEKSTLYGDIVEHYLRITPGKRGITFVHDVDAATKVAAAFNDAGVPAAAVSAKTPDIVRNSVIDKFRRGELLQLVNVDLFGEGFDVPAVEVVSMGRRTESFGLYCLSPDTEVLTPNGWVGPDDISEGGDVMAFDMYDESIKTVPIESYVRRELYDNEEMFEFSSPNQDILVSDQHRMLVMSRSKTTKNWKIQTAREVSERRGMFKIPVCGDGLFRGTGLSNSQLHFIGWFLSDGCMNKATNAVQIGQSAAKEQHLNHIESAIIGCGFKYGRHTIVRKNCPKTHSDVTMFTVSKGAPRGRDKHLAGWGDSPVAQFLDKSLPSCFDDMTRSEFLTMLEAVNLGDGQNNHQSLSWVKRTLTITCGDNEVMADRLQAMCVVRGLRCMKSSCHYEGRNKWFTLHIKDTRHVMVAGEGVKDGEVLGRSYRRSRFQKSQIKPEFVWCVSNQLGTLITRRRGKVTIMGNCQQFGRALRTFDGKRFGIIIDHVGNVKRHGLPDAIRGWQLLAEEKGRRGVLTDPNVLPTTSCTACFRTYERIHKACPFCGNIEEPSSRSDPKFVDGDLSEYGPELLEELRQKAQRLEGDAAIPPHLKNTPAEGAIRRRHGERAVAREYLKDAISQWAGVRRQQGMEDSEIYRRFYHMFGIDIGTAQTLDATAEVQKLTLKVQEHYWT